MVQAYTIHVMSPSYAKTLGRNLRRQYAHARSINRRTHHTYPHLNIILVTSRVYTNISAAFRSPA